MAGTARFVCIHGHFYQPPRENPWIEEIERQPDAHPYHDWNARIDAECYAPNGAAPVLDPDGRIARLVNNYARMSFNFGPTLLAWMERHARWTYDAVLEADRAGLARFGHGPAIAQAYGHAILPLLDARDRRMHVVWGIRDFEHRFGRTPQGMWLPETAADVASLETLAECGIRFTILAPHQARRVRAAQAPAWIDLDEGAVDTRRAYRAHLPSGRTIDVLFYDGPLSRAIAFEHLLSDGERFAGRLLTAFSSDDAHAQIVHVATDGETYGHHHRFGEMALAWTLERIEQTPGIELTNHAAFLAAHPPEHEVEIRDLTSWSCPHGVSRWTDDCGCNLGLDRGARQRWRRPLREAVDLLRGRLAEPWERAAAELFADPWMTRERYIEIVLDPRPERIDAFLDAHAAGPPGDPERRREALDLLEIQRHAQLTTTSCGWFFDDVSGIETVQVLRYAARAMELARSRLSVDLEAAVLEVLEGAPSNFPEWRNGRRVWERAVAPARVTHAQIAAHVALGRLFDDPGSSEGLPAFRIDDRRLTLESTGRFRLASGTVAVEHRRTRERSVLTAVAAHLGDHTLLAGVGPYDDEPSHAARVEVIREAFRRADVPGVLGRIAREFPGSTFEVGSLFDDRRRRIIGKILSGALDDAETSLERIYERHAPTLRFLASHDTPLPAVLRTTVEFVLAASLRRAFAGSPPDLHEIRRAIDALDSHRLRIDDPGLALDIASSLDRLARSAGEPGAPADRLVVLAEALEAALRLPLEFDLHVLHRLAAGLRSPGDAGRAAAALTRIDRALGFAASLRRTPGSPA